MKRILSVLATALLVISCGCSDTGKTVRLGGEVEISEKCIGAKDEESYKQMTDYCVRKDETGLEIMKMQGKIDILYTGTKGTVTDLGFDKIKIRLLNGDEYWCCDDFVEVK